jgi:hypothetical protein
MSVRLSEAGVIALEGHGGLDDAESLLLLLSANPGASVDWRRCAGVHAAVLQLLMISGAPLIGPPNDAHLRDVVQPALMRYAERGFPDAI